MFRTWEDPLLLSRSDHPFFQADGSMGMHIYPSGKLCDCCGNSTSTKSKGSLLAQYEVEVEITFGKRINKTVLGINIMSFAGVRLAGNGAGGGAREFENF